MLYSHVYDITVIIYITAVCLKVVAKLNFSGFIFIYCLQIRDAPDEDTLRLVAIEEVDIVIEAGFSKIITKLTMADKDELVHIVALHHTILKCKAELDDMLNGLESLGVAEMLRLYPNLLQPYFTAAGTQVLTAGILN